MADISSYLAAILAAVYGEQVRGSIHDAIEIINDAMEVSISAGTAISSASSSSTGFFENSLYINTSTYDLWKCTGTNTWTKLGNLRGNGIASLVKTSTSGNVDTYTITFDDGSTETFDVTNGIDGVNGSIWYKGTALTGTGTSITGFPGVVNDFYLNSNTGYVYCCTKTGGAMVPDAAEWDYVMTLTGGGGGGSIIVIDNLTSASSTDALSANQGRVLKNLVDQKADSSSLAAVATSGSFTDLASRYLGNMSNVSLSSPVGYNDALVYDDINSVWTNKQLVGVHRDALGSEEVVQVTSTNTWVTVTFSNINADNAYILMGETDLNGATPTADKGKQCKYQNMVTDRATNTLTVDVMVPVNPTNISLLEVTY